MRDVLRFAFGDRSAIERVSGSLWSLPVGALLIGVAVVARNYDQASLVHSPERIVAPYAISLMSSALIFVVLYRSLGVSLWKSGPSFRWQYLGFLGAFWMTAPIEGDIMDWIPGSWNSDSTNVAHTTWRKSIMPFHSHNHRDCWNVAEDKQKKSP